MKKPFRIRMSTMELVLIGTLLGSLVLALLQARQDERRQRQMQELGDHQ